MKTAYHSDLAALIVVATIVAVLTGFGSSSIAVAGQNQEPAFTSEFRLQDCEFQSRGANPYFILTPGYQLVLSGRVTDDNNQRVTESVEITVLGQTRNIFVPGVGNVTTRVVQERHKSDGDIVEISKNYFAICDKTNDVFYFGEDVQIFENGTTSTEGSWLAGQNGARPGLIMPGTFLLGSRYFQEVAPEVALDRAEHVAMGLRVRTAVGTFEDCVRVLETTPLEPGVESEKVYCPGVGLVQDDELKLVDIDR